MSPESSNPPQTVMLVGTHWAFKLMGNKREAQSISSKKPKGLIFWNEILSKRFTKILKGYRVERWTGGKTYGK